MSARALHIVTTPVVPQVAPAEASLRLELVQGQPRLVAEVGRAQVWCPVQRSTRLTALIRQGQALVDSAWAIDRAWERLEAARDGAPGDDPC